jgi:hypothetical protein
MMHLLIPDSYILLETKKSDTLVEERIYIGGASFETERPFKPINSLLFFRLFLYSNVKLGSRRR